MLHFPTTILHYSLPTLLLPLLIFHRVLYPHHHSLPWAPLFPLDLGISAKLHQTLLSDHMVSLF